jgi:hypothetical protein
MVCHCRRPKLEQLDSYVEFDAINNTMTDTEKPTPSSPPQAPVARPNESTGLNIDEHVKIFDPNTKVVILEKRA